MSEWYEATEEDIDIDFDDKEVNFHVCSNDFGNVYLSLSFDQIRDISKKLGKEKI